MRDRVKHVVARVLEVDPSEIADDAATEQFAAWDSLRQLELVLELEAEFGVRVSSDTITELTSVPKIEEYLAQSAA
jgi:acyl carrier protein